MADNGDINPEIAVLDQMEIEAHHCYKRLFLQGKLELNWLRKLCHMEGNHLALELLLKEGYISKEEVRKFL